MRRKQQMYEDEEEEDYYDEPGSQGGMPLGAVSQWSPQSNANMIIMTDPEEQIKRLEATYRGEVLDLNGNYSQKYVPIMNEVGVSKVIGLIRSAVSRISLMSHVDDHTYQQIMFEMGMSLHKILLVSRVAYKIQSNADRELIKTSALTTCQLCILRALEGGERKFWKGTVQEFTYNVPNQQEQGWFEKFMPKSWQQK